MNRHFVSLLLFVLALAVTCCDDILETDLSDDTVMLRLPADGVTQKDSVAVSFWWEELAGASRYELQVVSPDNINPSSLVLDTLVTKTQFSAKLPAGQYQWCVRGINSGYKTEFVCRSITITKTAVVPPAEILTLLLPKTGVSLVGPRDVNFSWKAYTGAVQYTLLIVSPNYQESTSKELEEVLTTTEFTHTLTAGQYDWCVKVLHTGGETEYVCHSITITKE